MTNLCDSANNGGEGTYDVLYLPTVVTAAAMPAGEARPPGIAKQSATAESDIAVSPGEAGPSWPRAKSTPSAVVTAAAMPAGEARPPGIEKNRVPRQNPRTQCHLVKLGLLGLEQMA